MREIGEWTRAEGVDAWYHAAPHLIVHAAPGQEHEVRPRGRGRGRRRALGRRGARALRLAAVHRRARGRRPGRRCSPRGSGSACASGLLDRGVRIHEHTRVRGLEGAVARTDGGRVRAGTAVVAVGPASGALRPLRNRLTVSSSHIVLTEPVPDVVAAIGWTGGEAISDGRTLLHYLRTTPDGRILFGWAGGRMAMGARTGGRMEVDPDVIGRAKADLVRFFPALAGRAVERAWGGPIDVSPTHLPFVTTLPGGRAHAAFGYTGNGVGPTHVAGQALAALALGRTDGAAALPIVGPPPKVPPEPFRVLGAAAIRRALVAKEAAEQDGRTPSLAARALAEVPARMGMHIVR